MMGSSMPNINNYDFFLYENRHNCDRERPFITINSMHFKTIIYVIKQFQVRGRSPHKFWDVDNLLNQE